MKEQQRKLREIFDQHIFAVYTHAPLYEMTKSAYMWIEFAIHDGYDALLLTPTDLLWRKQGKVIDSLLPSEIYQKANIYETFREAFLEIRELDPIVRDSTYVEENEDSFILHIDAAKLLAELDKNGGVR